MFLIDYEYAANNDPMWDLGDFSVEGRFTPLQDAAMIEAYFGGEAPAADIARMVIYKALSDLLWALWGIIQHVNRNPVDDFWAYATGRFDRCRTLMESQEFAAAVELLRGS
jgi:thiamine kinase-like enzyme